MKRAPKSVDRNKLAAFHERHSWDYLMVRCQECGTPRSVFMLDPKDCPARGLHNAMRVTDRGRR